MRTSALRFAVAARAVLLISCHAASTQRHAGDTAIVIGENDLGGVVTSANAAEAEGTRPKVVKFQLRPDPLARQERRHSGGRQDPFGDGEGPHRRSRSDQIALTSPFPPRATRFESRAAPALIKTQRLARG
jgi:hypothetical protein